MDFVHPQYLSLGPSVRSTWIDAHQFGVNERGTRQRARGNERTIDFPFFKEYCGRTKSISHHGNHGKRLFVDIYIYIEREGNHHS